MKPAKNRNINCRVNRQTDEALERAARERGVSKSDLAREAIRRLLSRQSFDRCRAIARPYAEAMGVYSDEDVAKVLDGQ